ncbi:hypothetical protein FE392_14450 [Xenorhabdus sp. 12]|uniref:Peptidase C58 YopT-type domain-containing protein n=1 Tax=Xenorhabdus santafensis TaxID=2582833 RepID=A0ABU4SCJ0_9GAMM|nr:hypothetical protein [Xenorhabdus sp. 12]MDX7988518.1 hypothetical protein [Xenorhabdus sp. 12]
MFHDLFKFKQSDYVPDDNKGWCFGISYVLLSYLVNIQNSKQLSPDTSFYKSKEYLDKFNSADSETKEKLISVVAKVQKNNRSTYLSTQSYSMVNQSDANGYGILGLVYSPTKNNVDKLGHFYKNPLYPPNHGGVIVWSSSQIFIFDPNCGGYLYRCCLKPYEDTISQMADKVLEGMYPAIGSSRFSRISLIERPTTYLSPAEIP